MVEQNSLKVSVILVTYKEKELQQCLQSLSKETLPIEVFVVVNGASDDTINILERSRIPVRTIFNKQNMGLAYANNQPLTMCTGQYVLILDPDTNVKDGAISAMVAYMEKHVNIGVVGPKILSSDGSIERSFLQNWNLITSVAWGWITLRLPKSLTQRYRITTIPDTQNVLLVSGACLMIRKQLYLDLGGYDSNFFLSLDDVADLCLRVRSAGYQVAYYPAAEVVHAGGRGHKNVTNIFWNYQGHLYYAAKYFTNSATLLLRVELFIDSLIGTTLSVVIIGVNGLLRRRGDRRRLKAFSFAASKLLVEPINHLYGDGLYLTRILINDETNDYQPSS